MPVITIAGNDGISIEKKREIWQKIIANAKNEKVDNK